MSAASESKVTGTSSAGDTTDAASGQPQEDSRARDPGDNNRSNKKKKQLNTGGGGTSPALRKQRQTDL